MTGANHHFADAGVLANLLRQQDIECWRVNQSGINGHLTKTLALVAEGVCVALFRRELRLSGAASPIELGPGFT